MGERQGGYFWDLEGKRLMDVHVNGGTFSLGHRNPEVIHALIEATAQCDIGNHHFPSVVKAKLAKTLVETATPGMTHAIYGSSGGEIVDLALKTAHHATGRKRIISVQNCYHGHTGIAVTTGADRFAEIFLAQGTEKTNTKVPFNDLDAMEEALKQNDAACVIMETIPHAKAGIPKRSQGPV